MTCPICRHRVAAKQENPAFPFCSERCRLIDLGNWLGESYRLPVEEEDDQPEDVTPGGFGESGSAPRR